MSVYVDDPLVCRPTCIPEGHLHRVTNTRCRTDTILLMMGTQLLETCREKK